MSVESDFREKVAGYLEQLSDPLKSILRKLIDYEYPVEVAALEFEIFSDGFCSRFPVRAFFMDEDNSEHFVYINGEAEYPCPVDPELLDIEKVYPLELEEEFEGKDASLDVWGLAANELVKWFSRCWLESGGRNFPIKASIGEHDDDQEFNLIESQWQERW